MEPRVNYTLVGLFVVLLGTGIVIATLWLAAGGFEPEMNPYLVYTTESVAGLNTGAPVTYHGVNVGYVSAISLDPENPQQVRLLLHIEQNTPIKEDTQAMLELQSFVTGLKFVELVGGSPDSPPLEPEPGWPPYPVIPTRPSLQASLEELLPELVADLRTTAAQLAMLTERATRVLSDDNLRAISATLDHLETVSGTLAAESRTIARTLEQTERLTTQAAEALPPLAERTRETLQATQRAMAAVRQAAANIGGAAGQLEAGLGERAEGLLDDLSRLVANLNTLVEEVERRPSTLLFGRERAPGPGERQ